MIKNFILIFALFLLINTQLPSMPLAMAESDVISHDQVAIITGKRVDPRAYILKNYLAQFESPLQNHAQDFVDAADYYKMDWKLVPAISGVESTFGKRIPGGFNGWGWGVYGTQAIYFKSWTDGIYTVSKGLKENYINKGLTEPYAMNRIYAASPTWGSKVSFFITEIDKYYKENSINLEIAPKITLNEIPAGSSASLAKI